ncbi:MAG: glutathione S-transferase [Burkholderiales bacterium]|jgi:glutathione S-transferase|nr:glutathione S-transferase [Burkholderiales bacterium]
MELIGMLDSPYVRRVAVSLQLLGLEFRHRPLSVFRTFEQFQRINPVVKAPTLICDDGQTLMDSSLILDYAEALAGPGKSLLPHDIAPRQQALQRVGLALAACEKSVQIVYERNLRPVEKRHEPWLQRVTGQLLSAYDGLEAALAQQPFDVQLQAGICTAVAWMFTQQTVPDCVDAARYPHLAAHSAQAEQLPAFRAAPYGDGTYPVQV